MNTALVAATAALDFFAVACTPSELARAVIMCGDAFVAVQMADEGGFAPRICADLLAAEKSARAELANF